MKAAQSEGDARRNHQSNRQDLHDQRWRIHGNEVLLPDKHDDAGDHQAETKERRRLQVHGLSVCGRGVFRLKAEATTAGVIRAEVTTPSATTGGSHQRRRRTAEAARVEAPPATTERKVQHSV
jgi:hypothetical protein